MACMAAVHNSAGTVSSLAQFKVYSDLLVLGLLASRFFLGITEAGLFPGK